MKKLKGLGDYTSAAIASFAFGEPTGVVDGNVLRVLARAFGIADCVDEGWVKKDFQLRANRIIDPARPADFNQALMDFGALVCKPAQPDCPQCPMASDCLALARGKVADLPVKKAKKPRQKRFFHYLILRDEAGRYWMQQRESGDIWADLFEFPLLETSSAMEWAGLIQLPQWPGEVPRQTPPFTVIQTKKQLLTHREIHAVFYPIPALITPKQALANWRAVPADALPSLAMPRVVDWYCSQYLVNFEN